MKKLLKSLLVCACCAAILFTGGAMRIFASNITTPSESEPVLVRGIVTGKDDSRLQVTQTDPEHNNQEIVITVSDGHTRILDAVTGLPVSLDTIQDGSVIYAYVGPAMTLSLPPMANASLILTNIPADYKVPELLTVSSLELNADQTSGMLTATNGKQYPISANTQILPYLTRNIVTIQDLTPGKSILLWSAPNSDEAVKIVIFPEDTQSQQDQNPVQTGWVMRDGNWYYYDQQGALYTGWLKDNGNWYYLNPSTGAMHTGFLTLGNNTYFLQDNGQMLTTPRTFTPDASGALH